MTFLYRFTSTHRDLLDALDAYRTWTLGMRRFARIAIAGLALMWLAGGIAAPFLSAPPLQPRWLPILWLMLGASTTWKFVLEPMRLARDIRNSTPPAQEVLLTFRDSGIGAEVHGVGAFERTWDEVVGIFAARKGIAFGFVDGVNHWLPNRVFTDATERAQFIEYVQSKITRDDGRRSAPGDV